MDPHRLEIPEEASLYSICIPPWFLHASTPVSAAHTSPPIVRQYKKALAVDIRVVPSLLSASISFAVLPGFAAS